MRFAELVVLAAGALAALSCCSASRAPDTPDAAEIADAASSPDAYVGCGESYLILTFAFPGMPAVSVCAPLDAQGVQAAYRVQRASGGGFTPCVLYAGGFFSSPVETPLGATAFGASYEAPWLDSPDGALVQLALHFTFPEGGPCGGGSCRYDCSAPDLAEMEIIESSAVPGEVVEARLRSPCALTNPASPTDTFVPIVSELHVRGVVTSRTSLLVGGFTEPTTETSCP